MGVTITGVAAGSPAARRGIRAGDELLRMNGHDIEDVLDYRFYMGEAALTLTLSREGKKRLLRLHKRPEEDPGLEFATYLMDAQHSCRNRCIFCFIDQLPPGMRESLYFKDDDSRLSFLFGNYVTLTNLSEHEIQRIIAMHISPINISVHTTNPALRCRMMGNRFAGDRLEVMRRFAAAGIRMECQLVLCPGVNDGEELARTMEDLAALAPAVESVAAVPVGLTRYRQGLPALRMYTREEAAAVVRQLEAFGERMLAAHGNRIFYPADEFYLQAGLPVPEDEAYYGDFSQLENGVGMTALLKAQFRRAMEACTGEPRGSRLTLATGAAARPLLEELAGEAKARWPAIRAEVVSVRNDFFGETITVAGLVTGGDLIRQLKGRTGEVLVIPEVMLRHEGDIFLDGVSREDVERELGVKLVVSPVDGDALLEALFL
ncbi:MAG TPA: DUF512 domain-containing protein [Firmicutes bacterium]|nr:DUF512 domain-containing protein [Bacillota bacterium]